MKPKHDDRVCPTLVCVLLKIIIIIIINDHIQLFTNNNEEMKTKKEQKKKASLGLPSPFVTVMFTTASHSGTFKLFNEPPPVVILHNFFFLNIIIGLSSTEERKKNDFNHPFRYLWQVCCLSFERNIQSGGILHMQVHY